MSNPNLSPEPEALEAWEKLPKNLPSRQALPPMTGGTRWMWGLLIVLSIVIIFGLLQGRMG